MTTAHTAAPTRTWLDRARLQLQILEGQGAPEVLRKRAYDCVQCFVAAKELRKRVGNRAAAQLQHRLGVAAYNAIQDERADLAKAKGGAA
jgi:hypothetical protein